MNTDNKILNLRRFAVAAIMLFAVLCMSAQYSIQSFTGNVDIKRGGQLIPASISMKVGGADLIVIHEGASVQILDKRNSQLFTRSEPGEIGVPSLIYDARKASRSNAGAVHRKITMGKSSSAEGKMYVEKGRITLALEEYDPAGEAFAVDPDILARYVAAALNAAADSTELPTFPTAIEHSSGGTGGVMFRVDNKSAEPMYINVIKVARGDDGTVRLKLSEIGQPVGCYVLLPNQSIMRSQTSGINRDYTHMLVATHYYFSIDSLLEHLNKVLVEESPDSSQPLPMLPIYVQKL